MRVISDICHLKQMQQQQQANSKRDTVKKIPLILCNCEKKSNFAARIFK